MTLFFFLGDIHVYKVPSKYIKKLFLVLYARSWCSTMDSHIVALGQMGPKKTPRKQQLKP
jgi:hypothetical protein